MLRTLNDKLKFVLEMVESVELSESEVVELMESSDTPRICVHHQREWDSWMEEEYIRTFIAHPEWVEQYHRSGGIWAYAD